MCHPITTLWRKKLTVKIDTVGGHLSFKMINFVWLMLILLMSIWYQDIGNHQWVSDFIESRGNFTTRQGTVYPKKYAHGFCFAVLCCGYTLTYFPISTRLTSLALWQSNDCPSASKATLMNMDKYFMWIHYERLHNHNKAKHNKTVCIFLGIYCAWLITQQWLSGDIPQGICYRMHELSWFTPTPGCCHKHKAPAKKICFDIS